MFLVPVSAWSSPAPSPESRIRPASASSEDAISARSRSASDCSSARASATSSGVQGSSPGRTASSPRLRRRRDAAPWAPRVGLLRRRGRARRLLRNHRRGSRRLRGRPPRPRAAFLAVALLRRAGLLRCGFLRRLPSCRGRFGGVFAAAFSAAAFFAGGLLPAGGLLRPPAFFGRPPSRPRPASRADRLRRLRRPSSRRPPSSPAPSSPSWRHLATGRSRSPRPWSRGSAGRRLLYGGLLRHHGRGPFTYCDLARESCWDDKSTPSPAATGHAARSARPRAPRGEACIPLCPAPRPVIRPDRRPGSGRPRRAIRVTAQPAHGRRRPGKPVGRRPRGAVHWAAARGVDGDE